MARGHGPFPERLRVEWSGDELLVLDPDRGLLHRVLPLDLRAIATGRDLPHYAAALGPEVLDAVRRALSEQRWDRRRVLTSTSAAAAAGITTMLLPSSVMALSVGGVAYGRNVENGSFILNPVNITSSGLNSASSSGSLTGSGVARWQIPAGVTQLEILAIGTDGEIGQGREARAGTGGSAAAVGGRFPVSEGDWIHINFTPGSDYSSGSASGSAAGVGLYRAAGEPSSAWLVVAGGGGGGGRDGSADPGEDYVGGRGGDAGTGAAAGSGQAGQYTGIGSPALPLGGGGGGATLSAAGVGAGTNGDSRDGNDGGSPLTGDMFHVSDNYVRLGSGGLSGNNTYGGGNGAAGYYGGGAGEGIGSTGVTGGGGGGSSLLNTEWLAEFSPGATIGLYARSRAQGPYIAIYY